MGLSLPLTVELSCDCEAIIYLLFTITQILQKPQSVNEEHMRIQCFQCHIRVQLFHVLHSVLWTLGRFTLQNSLSLGPSH